MKTLYDLGMEITKIREAANSLEVKGEQNASLVIYIFRKCNEIIEEINVIVNNFNDGQNGEDQSHEEGQVNGQPDSGTA